MPPRTLRAGHLLLLLDLTGTALFAAEGATTAMMAHLDLLGVLVLAFITALGGGIIRDLLIGAVPPNAIRDWRYPATALVTAALAFTPHATTAAMNPQVLLTLDAAGLALFAVAGAIKASEYGLHALLATIMGGITGAGGGTLRDLLILKVPSVLNADFYAAAALIGSAVTLLCLRTKMPTALAGAIGFAFCFVLRMLAIRYHWSLPHA